MTFTADDVVRHELVARIVAAYDNAAAKKRETPASERDRTARRRSTSIVESPLWDARAPRRPCAARSSEAATALGADFRNHALAVLLTDDAAIRRLNAQWRDIDKPTNVLSFPPAADARRRRR